MQAKQSAVQPELSAVPEARQQGCRVRSTARSHAQPESAESWSAWLGCCWQGARPQGGPGDRSGSLPGLQILRCRLAHSWSSVLRWGTRQFVLAVAGMQTAMGAGVMTGQLAPVSHTPYAIELNKSASAATYHAERLRPEEQHRSFLMLQQVPS
jgi:hypothetical protein